MSIGKYSKALVIYISLMVLVIILGLILGAGEDAGPNWIRFSPTRNAGHDVIYMFIMITLCGIIGGVLIGYALGPLFLIAHKKIIGRKMIYGIQDKAKPEKFRGYILYGLFPALMALNFALLFALSKSVQRIAVTQPDAEIAPMLTLSTLLALMTGISMGLFSPIWFLLDSGIVYTNKEKVKDKAYPTEIRSVGGWYIYLLKGYAGISVLISFYSFFFYIYEVMGISRGVQGMALMFVIFYPLLPLVITILCIPSFILLDLTHNIRREYIRNVAKKFGISGPLEDPLDLR